MNDQQSNLLNDNDMTMDWGLMRAIVRRRALLWTFVGVITALVLLLALLWKIPSKYSSTTSLSLQQPSEGGSGGSEIAALAGFGGSAAKSYAGVIHSRTFAIKAVRKVGVQEAYGFRTADEAVTVVQEAVKLEDRNDGLLYLSITLPGPSHLAIGNHANVGKIKVATQQLTVVYTNILRNYLQTSNIDRGAALLRQAKIQRDLTREEYRKSVRRLFRISTSDTPVTDDLTAVLDSRNPAAVSVNQPANFNDAANLSQLYMAQGQLVADIESQETAMRGTERLAERSANGLAVLPAEDPLLAEARAQVRRAVATLQDLRIGLSEDNPEVVLGKARLQQAQEHLRSQSNALQAGNTSNHVQLNGMKAKLAEVRRQIVTSERHFKVGRSLAAQTEQRRNDVSINLDVYKTAASQYATLAMQKVAGGNLMEVIDPGMPPAPSGPGIPALLLISIAGALFLVNCWFVTEYIYLARRNARIAFSEASARLKAIPG